MKAIRRVRYIFRIAFFIESKEGVRYLDVENYLKML